ncbi:MAG: hypothetical protein AAF543_10470 [Pseudomonadota bacterium]
MSAIPALSDRSARLAELRRQIGRLERSLPTAEVLGRSQTIAVGQGRIDPLLASGGDAEPALHELVADSYGNQPAVRDIALTLAASLLHREKTSEKMVLWCQRQHDLHEFGSPYAPGLRDIGLPPDRLLMVTGRRDADCLWAMEQGLASRSLLAVIGMVESANLIATRRLSLAALAHRTSCFLLPLDHGREPSAARIRWRIKAAASRPDHLDPKGLGPPAWYLNLERSPNGRTGHWTVEWDHAAHHFHLVPQSPNQPVAARNSDNKQASDVVALDRAG